MKLQSVHEAIGSLLFLRLRDARVLYDLIAGERVGAILHLGVFSAAAVVYLAGAAAEVGNGELQVVAPPTQIDKLPSIIQALEACGLTEHVHFHADPFGSHWWLMKRLTEQPRPYFDLCFLDLPPNFHDAGMAFFLARRLVRPGGWFVLNSMEYTYRDSPSRGKPWVLKMTEEEQVTAQIERVFSLLVMEDESLETFRVKGNLGIARKRLNSMLASPESQRRERVVFEAARLAYEDAPFRQKLLHRPASALAEISGQPKQCFLSVRFAENNLWAPTGPDVDEAGVTTHMLEHPLWHKQILEADLLAMLGG